MQSISKRITCTTVVLKGCVLSPLQFGATLGVAWGTTWRQLGCSLASTLQTENVWFTINLNLDIPMDISENQYAHTLLMSQLRSNFLVDSLRKVLNDCQLPKDCLTTI